MTKKLPPYTRGATVPLTVHGISREPQTMNTLKEQQQQQQQQQHQQQQQISVSEGLQCPQGYRPVLGGSSAGIMMDLSSAASSVTPDMVPAQPHLASGLVSSNAAAAAAAAAGAGLSLPFVERLEQFPRLLGERSGGLEGVDEPADYTVLMSSADDEHLPVMEGFTALAPHHMESSDNDHEHYNELEASGAECGAERERKGASSPRKRKSDAVSSAARSSGEATAEAKKAKASRDRNREHARNTRIRKKQYIENLKLQIGEMLQSKARDERDAILNSSRESASRVARRQTVLHVFYLRATKDLSRHSWAAILDPDFTCITPITPYRSFLPAEIREFRRVIKGIDGMIQDTASLAVFMQSICRRAQNPTGQKVKYQFYASADDTVVGPHGLMSRWLMKTENAIECGALCEVFSHGMLKAQFASDNKIKRLELEFDVMSFMQQQQRALGDGEFRVVPNTLEAAIQPSRHARVVCSAQSPYWIRHANQAWTCLVGHSEEEAKLFTVSLLDGPAEATNGGEFNAFVHSCMGSTPPRAGMTELHVVVRDLRRVTVEVQLYPLGTADGGLTHVVMIMEETPMCQGLPQAGLDLFNYV